MISVTQQNSENKGQFTLLDDGKQIGLMTYSKAGKDKIIIDHTEVDPAYKGQGMGEKLVYAGVEYARNENLKILPLCPFAKIIFAKNKEIQDVRV
ncbi:GNAT family N-acetyltransferase [Belliella marina]|uniref:GNAT family N-acetyltransferase n=1 Tax=Belliella marina TaxID=1644146 RepID=A0ABW4VRR5_9BACT